MALDHINLAQSKLGHETIQANQPKYRQWSQAQETIQCYAHDSCIQDRNNTQWAHARRADLFQTPAFVEQTGKQYKRMVFHHLLWQFPHTTSSENASDGE